MTDSNRFTGSPVGPLAGAIGAWQLDPSATTIELHTRTMWGLAKITAVFRAAGGAGTVGDDGSVTGTLVIDAASVDTKIKKRNDHLRDSDFFEVETYPTFTYTVTGARPVTGNQLMVSGTLTVHGVSRPLDVPVVVTEAGPDRVLSPARSRSTGPSGGSCGPSWAPGSSTRSPWPPCSAGCDRRLSQKRKTRSALSAKSLSRVTLSRPPVTVLNVV